MPEGGLTETDSSEAAIGKRQTPSCAVLVVSCDRYRDLWKPFFALFRRYWPDCPFPVYLGSNFASYPSERITSLQVGEDRSWSRNLRFFLENIPSQYVLLLLEDFFLNRPVSTAAFLERLSAFDRLGGSMLRVYPKRGPNQKLSGSRSIGAIHRLTPYRVSAQAAIWNRQELLALLRDDESAWEFEHDATARSQAKEDGFFSTYAPLVSYRHVVEQGEWFWSAASKYGKQNIGCDFGARRVMGPVTAAMKRVNNGRSWVLDRFMDWRLRRRIRGSAGVEANASQRRENLRIAFLTNIIPPYHRPVLDLLAAHYGALRVLLSTPMESNRPWKPTWGGLDVIIQKTITLKGRWRHPNGFSEPLAVHLPIDTFRQLGKFRAAVVISGEMGARTLLATIYRRLHRRTRLIVWAEVAESTEQGRGWARRVFRRLLHRNVDAFLVTGESGSRYIRSLGVNDRKIFKISYTTDLQPFVKLPLERPESAARRLLYVGQLVERKGLVPFIEILFKWAYANGDRAVELVLAGDGPMRATLERLALPPNAKLTFLGSFFYEDLPNVYAEAGIFVLPTLADTWGVVVNEAMAAGLPVLGSTYSQAVAEMVKDGKNGWVFRGGHADGMYGALDRSMNVPSEKLNEMRQCARETAEHLTPEYVAGLVEAAIDACAKDLR